MILSFQTKWDKEMGYLAGMPNYFVEKIWAGLIEKTSLSIKDYSNAHYDHVNRFGKDMSDYKDLFIDPKYHTIRHDPHNRWREGMDIHFAINNRTKDRFQFAPVVKCAGVQKIEIRRIELDGQNVYEIFVDEKWIRGKNLEQLAINDGFDSVNDFFRFFNKPFVGKIIHWTDLRY